MQKLHSLVVLYYSPTYNIAISFKYPSLLGETPLSLGNFGCPWMTFRLIIRYKQLVQCPVIIIISIKQAQMCAEGCEGFHLSKSFFF